MVKKKAFAWLCHITVAHMRAFPGVSTFQKKNGSIERCSIEKHEPRQPKPVSS